MAMTRDWCRSGATKGMAVLGLLRDRVIVAWGAVFFLAMVAGASPGVAFGVSGTPPALTSITPSALPGERAEVTLRLSGPAPEPDAFTTDNPARIVLDFPGVTNRLGSAVKSVSVGMLRTITAVEAMGRTRVVLGLVQPVAYKVRTAGDQVMLTLEGGTAEARPAPAPYEAAAAGGGAVTNVDFHRGTHGAGQVSVTFSQPVPTVDVREEGGKIVVDFPGVRLPAPLQRRLNVVDFATPVETIDTVQEGANTRLTVKAQGDYEHFAYQADKTFTLEVRPLTPQQLEAKKKKYTGERLSLNFQDIEVRAVLQLLADFTDLNIVASDTVTGHITLRLKDVPWDQALDIILRIKGLGKRQEGNVLWVAPLAEIAAREKQELQAMKEKEQLAPLRSEYIQINYAKASDLAALLKAKENSLLSERGAVTVDERTNTLLVQDTADKLEEIRRLVAKLDIPVRQVMIDSRIVIANDNFARDLGVRLGVTATQTTGNKFLTTTGSISGPSSTGTNTIIGDAISNITNTGQPYPVTPPQPNDRFNVNLPATPQTGTAGTIAFGILGANYLVDLELSALQSEGKGEVLSNPRVVTADSQMAVIKQGTEIPYQSASSSGATSTSFKDAVLELDVTPHITPDDRISMKLKVSKDSVGQFVPSGFAGGFVPSIDTRSVETNVLVDNGETVVLGGIFEHTRTTSNHHIPLLGDIPLFGHLFRQDDVLNNKDELLIFVTPKIIKEGFKTD
jgi:type IV pilus assembly protein PilQ